MRGGSGGQVNSTLESVGELACVLASFGGGPPRHPDVLRLRQFSGTGPVLDLVESREEMTANELRRVIGKIPLLALAAVSLHNQPAIEIALPLATREPSQIVIAVGGKNKSAAYPEDTVQLIRPSELLLL
jgi:hypothetical protein